MKILLICQHYYPEPFRITDICEELVKRGHDVFVVTGMPNYPQGKIYKGYGRGEKRDEIINGVKIHRCFTIARRKGPIFRLLNYWSFSWSSKNYIKNIKEDYDVVFVNQLSPVMMANAGVVYKKKRSKKIVMYCLDLWPESLLVGGVKKGSFIYKHYHKVAEKIYKQTDKILTTSRSFADYFDKEFGIKNTEYLPQYAEELFTPENCYKKPDEFVDLMFAGNIGAAQSVDTILEAAKLLKDINNLRWHIVGDGSESERLKREVKNLDNVFFYDRQPIEKMPEFYSKADAMLVTLQKGSFLSNTLPGKVQTYLAAGKPIIGVADGEIKTVIEESGCGVCCEAENADKLAQVVLDFINLLDRKVFSKNAIEYYRNNFTKEEFFNKLISFLEDYKS